LCSSALDYTPSDSPLLRTLESTVESILRTAMRLGETMIVTNGCNSWVQESSAMYLPALVPTLESLPVMSARHMYEKLYPADPASWKRRAFRKILKKKRASGHGGLNMVVLGDQSAEMQAVHCAAKVLRGPSLIKTVKFVEAPSVEQLLGQLRKVAQELGGLVCAENSSSTDLTKRRLRKTESHLEAWATGWTFSLGRDWAKLPAVLRPRADEEDEGLSEGEACPGLLQKDCGAAHGGKLTQEWCLEEIFLDDPVEAGGSSATPVCGVCPWGSVAARRVAPSPSDQDYQVLSI